MHVGFPLPCVPAVLSSTRGALQSGALVPLRFSLSSRIHEQRELAPMAALAAFMRNSAFVLLRFRVASASIADERRYTSEERGKSQLPFPRPNSPVCASLRRLASKAQIATNDPSARPKTEEKRKCGSCLSCVARYARHRPLSRAHNLLNSSHPCCHRDSGGERRVLSLLIERGPPKGPWAAWAWAGPLHRDLARVNQGSSV